MLSNDLSFQRPFVSGGRSYGGSDSMLIRPMLPLESISRIPWTAASAVMPPAMMRYLKLGMEEGATRKRNAQIERARSAGLIEVLSPLEGGDIAARCPHQKLIGLRLV